MYDAYEGYEHDDENVQELPEGFWNDDYEVILENDRNDAVAEELEQSDVEPVGTDLF